MDILKKFTDAFTEFKKLVDEHGPLTIINTLLLALIVSLGVYFIKKPEAFIERCDRYMEKKHEASFNYRMTNSPQVQTYLDDLCLETGAKRCFIIELHNGKTNATGLSFNYGKLSYESDRFGVVSVGEDYSDFSIERYPMAFKVYKEGYWTGSINDFMTIDKHLALKLRSNDAEYLCLSTLYGENGEIGFIGLSYGKGDKIMEKNKLHSCIVKYGNKISPLLDGAKAKVK